MPEILTPRLTLRLMDEDFLEASLRADRERTESLIGLKIPPDWFAEKNIINIRLRDYRADPEYAGWGLWAVGMRETIEMIGHIGFHTRPDPEYLRPLVPNAVEFGYTIFPAYRRRGFAREASIGFLQNAAERHPFEYFIASVAPTNIASTRLVRNLGFEKIGEQIDEVDGLELIYALAADKIPLQK